MSKILGPGLTLIAYLAIAYALGRRAPQEFVAAACGFLIGLLAAVQYWFPTRGTR